MTGVIYVHNIQRCVIQIMLGIKVSISHTHKLVHVSILLGFLFNKFLEQIFYKYWDVSLEC